MDVLIFTLGSLGDIHPFVGLGQALTARGHRVTLGANSAFRDLILAAGLEHEEVGTRAELDETFADDRFWHPNVGYRQVVDRIIMPAMRRQFEIVAGRRSERTVVVASTVSLGARIARDKLGVPVLGAHVQPMVIWSEYRSPVVGGLWLGDGVPRALKRWQYRLAESLTVRRWMLRPVNRFRAEIGLPRLRSMDELLHAPDGVLALFPEWFAPRQPDWPAQTRFVGFPLWDASREMGLDPRLETFLDAGDPPIAFTLSTTDWLAPEFYRAAVDACRALSCRGILLTRDRVAVPDPLPPEILRVDFAPFRPLLPRVRALVHHGGLGTGAQALAAGIPQVTRPACFDQPDNAERLERLGTSRTLSCRELDGPRLAAALVEMGSPAVRRRCREIARRLRTGGGLSEAVAVVERAARRTETRHAHASSG